jgi:hypothetical protein
MQFDNEVTLITILTELEAEFIVTLGGSGRDVVLQRNPNKIHRAGKDMFLPKSFQII